MIRLDGGTLAEANREVYLEWYRSKRQEQYQKERDWKYGVCSLEGLQEKVFFTEIDMYVRDVTQEAVFGNLEKDKLWYALKEFPGQDALLIRLLYFKGTTVKKVAEILWCSRKTVRNRWEKVLKELGRQLVD